MSQFFQVDAFSSRPFAGNPAAVCPLEGPRSESWMQAVAAEMNLSETAFLLPGEAGIWDLRWFTPVVEVDLCGHATLASAHVLWQAGLADDESLRFSTRSGILACTRRGDWIEMDLPADPPRQAEPPAALGAALGIEPRWFGRSRLYDFVRVDSVAELRSIEPDFSALRDVAQDGLCVTAPGEGEYDFLSRFFAPAAGIDEDPVTGSAHALLAPYWAGELHKTDLVGYQASARGGVVKVGERGERVLVAGQAVTVARGELFAS